METWMKRMWADGMQVAWRRGSWRACLWAVSMCERVCLCTSSLCGRMSMGQSDGLHRGSCHGSRGCRLVPPDLNCSRSLQTSTFQRRLRPSLSASSVCRCRLLFNQIVVSLTLYFSLMPSFISHYILPHSLSELLSCTADADINKLQSSCHSLYVFLSFFSWVMFRFSCL